MKKPDPVFTVLDIDSGKRFDIYLNGEIEGFPKHCLIMNNLSSVEAQAVTDFRRKRNLDQFGRKDN